MNIFDHVTRPRSNCFYLTVLFVAVGSAFALRCLADPLLSNREPFVFFYTSMVAVGICGRWQYSVSAALLSMLLAAFFFVPSWPANLTMESMAELADAGAFVLVSAMIIFLMHSMNRAVRNARSTEEALRQSERRLQIAVDATDLGTWQWNAQTDLLEWSDRCAAIYGMPPRNSSYAEFLQRVHPDDRPRVQKEVRHALTHFPAPKYNATFRAIRPDGDIRWVHVQAIAQPGEGVNGHEAMQFIGTARDITEQKESEERLREARVFEELMLNSSRDFSIMALDPEGKIIRWSVGAESMFGYAAEEVIGHPVDLIFTPEDRARGIPAEELQATLTGQRGLHERLHIRKDGSRLFLSGAIRPMYDGEGKLKGFAKIAHDSTERKQLEEALDHSRDNLEQIVQERTARLQETVGELEAFCYSLSHDLRAPLRAMESFSKILRVGFGERLGPDGIFYVDRIIRSAARLDNLIQDVLAFSRLAREPMKTQPVNIEELIRQLIAENTLFQPPQAEIQIAIPLLGVMGHEASLTQCIFNLFGNGVKFVAPGRTPKIRIWTEPVDSQVRLWIQDNGIGIASEHHKQIFGMFYRLHREQEYPGTGIGLAIVRKAVERMGGAVGLESEPGVGTRFWIQLQRSDSLGNPETAVSQNPDVSQTANLQNT
jgi:PAS domain S-box-containing protein